MTQRASRHRLIERQLKKARGKSPDATVDLDCLIDLVSQAYTEQDSTIRMHDRAAMLVSQEILELNEKLLREQELKTQASEALLKTVLDNATEAIISLDRKNQILLLNQAAEKIFGYPSNALVGKPISMLIGDKATESAATQWEAIEYALRENQTTTQELPCRRSSGELFPAELSFSRIPLERDFVLISFWRDISERKKAEEKIISAMEEAQAANLSKSNFLSNMSHELRTPLNAIIGFADLMRHENLGPIGQPKYRNYVSNIFESGAHLLALVNDILDLSRIESGRYDLVLEPIKIADMTTSIELQLGVLLQQGNIAFVNSVGGDLPFIMADRRALRQVLYNLLSNAIKFTPPGGRVTLSASRTPLGVELIVEDTGIGISKEDLPRLGNPFEQASQANMKPHNGAGLGLAITKKLVGLQNGTMTFDSELGVGSVFKLCFPSSLVDAQMSNSPKADEQAANAVNFQGARVLLAEDNAVNQMLARDILEGAGCEVVLADNGRKAIEQWRAHPCDLILMDCQMPELDGFEATHAIRELEIASAKHTPIIALTANAIRGERERCLAAGMDDYLSKPFQFSELTAMLQRWIKVTPQPPAAVDSLDTTLSNQRYQLRR